MIRLCRFEILEKASSERQKPRKLVSYLDIYDSIGMQIGSSR